MKNIYKIIFAIFLVLVLLDARKNQTSEFINKYEHTISVEESNVKSEQFLRLRRLGNIFVTVVQLFIQFNKEYFLPVLERLYFVLIKIPLENLKQFPRQTIFEHLFQNSIDF